MYIFLEFNILLLILLFIKSINCLETLINDGEEEEFCSIENPKTCSLEGNVYQHPDYNEIINNINTAKAIYTNCSQDLEDIDCKCHADVIRNDLSIFQTSGITLQMLEMATKFGTHYKVYKHKLFRNSKCMFPARCEGIEHFLLKLLPQLPDMDLVINTRDWPQIPKHQQNILPVFSFSKTANYADIMYPAWTFWAGGPAITLHPTGIGRWDLHRKNLSNTAELYKWDVKSAKGFFRGSRTSDERDALVLLSRKKFNLVDAQYTKNQAWKSPKDTLNAEPAKEVSFMDHCKYKYLFNFRGVAASFRLKHLFLCKSLVIHVGDEWLEFFYPALKPWVHYVPLSKYPTEDDIEKILAFFKTHDSLAKEIADRGYEFIWQHLRMSDVECYWKHLLDAYSKLITFQITAPDIDMIEITKKTKQF